VAGVKNGANLLPVSSQAVLEKRKPAPFKGNNRDEIPKISQQIFMEIQAPVWGGYCVYYHFQLFCRTGTAGNRICGG
jgi:hypothetical protein